MFFFIVNVNWATYVYSFVSYFEKKFNFEYDNKMAHFGRFLLLNIQRQQT